MRGYRGEAARLLRQRDEAQPDSRVSQVQTLLDSVQVDGFTMPASLLDR